MNIPDVCPTCKAQPEDVYSDPQLGIYNVKYRCGARWSLTGYNPTVAAFIVPCPYPLEYQAPLSLRIVGWFQRWLQPSYSACECCGRSWAWREVEEHTTYYSHYRGCFPLCEICWQAMTPTQRVAFYWRLHRNWRWSKFEQEWPSIKTAVLQGQ